MLMCIVQALLKGDPLDELSAHQLYSDASLLGAWYEHMSKQLGNTEKRLLIKAIIPRLRRSLAIDPSQVLPPLPFACRSHCAYFGQINHSLLLLKYLLFLDLNDEAFDLFGQWVELVDSLLDRGHFSAVDHALASVQVVSRHI